MTIISKHSRRLLLAAGISSALALAGLLLFCGLLTSEDSPGLIPPPEAEGGTIVPPSLTPAPEATLASAKYVTIRGQQVPLAPGMVYTEIGGGNLPPVAQPPLWMIDYDSNSAEAGISFVIFDNSYTLLQDNVRPKDREEFQPLLDALATP